MTSLVAQTVKHLPTMWETAAHSSTLAWKIPWTEEPGRLQSVGSQRVGHDWVTSLSLDTRQCAFNSHICEKEVSCIISSLQLRKLRFKLHEMLNMTQLISAERGLRPRSIRYQSLYTQPMFLQPIDNLLFVFPISVSHHNPPLLASTRNLEVILYFFPPPPVPTSNWWTSLASSVTFPSY